MLALAVLALLVSPAADGKMDVPPPTPIAAELAASFAGAVRRNTAFAAVPGRAVQPDMVGIAPMAPEAPAWIVEVRWKEKGTLRTGVAFVFDVPAWDKVKPGIAKEIPPALREGRWMAARVFEDVTFAGWAEQQQEQRRANNEDAMTGDIRSMISGQLVFHSSNGSYGEPRCLLQPSACVPGTKDPWLVEATTVAPEKYGYRRTFHPGAAVKGKSGQTGLVATWAYTAVPMDPKYGRRSFCGDSTGNVCAVAGATMPPLAGGACPKACSPVN